MLTEKKFSGSGLKGKTEEEKQKAIFESIKNSVDEFTPLVESLLKYQEEPTQEEIKMINTVINSLTSFCKDLNIEIPDKENLQMRILKEPHSVLKKMTGIEGIKGINLEVEELILITKSKSKIQFSLTLLHEMIHLISPRKRIISEENKMTPFQSGLLVFRQKETDEEMIAFNKLNEAVVVKISHEIQEKINENSIYTEELETTREIEKWTKKILDKNLIEKEYKPIFENHLTIPLEEGQYILKKLKSLENTEDQKLEWLKDYILDNFGKKLAGLDEYHNERDNLDKLLEELYSHVKKSDELKKKFTSKEDLFKEFKIACIKGEINHLAKLFKKIGAGTLKPLLQKFDLY